MLSTVPKGDEFEAVDLRALTLAPRFDSNAFAEARFLLSLEARDVQAEYVGFCSANYDRKFPKPPHLNALPRLARHLQPCEALGTKLATDWLAEAESQHPGMTAVLQRVATQFGLRMLPERVPYANTLVCHRDDWFRLLDALHSMLTAVLDWYGPRSPFRYRCLRCGTLSDTGHGRYTHERHIGYLAERLTMLHFASRPDIRFVTPKAVRLRTSRVARARSQLYTLMRARGIPVPQLGRAPSVSPLDGPRCPGCVAQAAPPAHAAPD
jgi:hypothetical protein